MTDLDARVAEAAQRLAARVAARPDGLTAREARQGAGRRDRDVLTEAIVLAVDRRWVVEAHEPGRGTARRVLRPGPETSDVGSESATTAPSCDWCGSPATPERPLLRCAPQYRSLATRVHVGGCAQRLDERYRELDARARALVDLTIGAAS